MPQPRLYPSSAARQAAYRQRCIAHQQRGSSQNEFSRLPAAPHVAAQPGARRWRLTTTYAILLLTTVEGEMQANHDQRSEQWQESDRGLQSLERIEALADLRDQLTEWLTT